MFKSIGLGIACLTLSIAGVTRATAINVDCGKYGDDNKGDNKCLKVDLGNILSDIKCLDINFDCGDKNLDCHNPAPVTEGDNNDGYGNQGGCDIKPVLCDDNHDNHNQGCDLTWTCGNDDHQICDLPPVCGDGNHNPGCGLGCDPCPPAPCDPSMPVCPPPTMVPAPASAAFGGVGVAGIMLLAAFRSRRSARA